MDLHLLVMAAVAEEVMKRGAKIQHRKKTGIDGNDPGPCFGAHHPLLFCSPLKHPEYQMPHVKAEHPFTAEL